MTLALLLLSRCWHLMQQQDRSWGLACPAEKVLEDEGRQQQQQQQLPPVPHSLQEGPVQDLVPTLLLKVLPAWSPAWTRMYGGAVGVLLCACRAGPLMEVAQHSSPDKWLRCSPEALACFLTWPVQEQNMWKNALELRRWVLCCCFWIAALIPLPQCRFRCYWC